MIGLWRRLMNWLFPPDCAECGRFEGRMLGSYWHADTCSHAGPPRYPAGVE